MESLFVLLDIDNTLYEFSETGFGDEMRERIFAYAEQNVGLSAEEAERLSHKYWLSYGLSLYGYVKDYHVNAREYSDFVHQCSYNKLHYNQTLVNMLLSMQVMSEDSEEHDGPRPTGVDHLYYFTNANFPHARKVLELQGLRSIFTRPRPTGISVKDHHRFDDPAGLRDGVEWLGFSYEDQWKLTSPEIANKPMRRAYEAVYKAIEDQIMNDAILITAETAEASCEFAGASYPAPSSSNAREVESKQASLSPERFVMVDDSLMNMDAPLELGWNAVWYAHGEQELPKDARECASAPLYAAAVASGRLQVIRNILDLKAAVDRIREVNLRSRPTSEVKSLA